MHFGNDVCYQRLHQLRDFVGDNFCLNRSSFPSKGKGASLVGNPVSIISPLNPLTLPRRGIRLYEARFPDLTLDRQTDQNNTMKSNYLFTSERLGFRNWTMDDLPEFAALNADEQVMEHFPNTATAEQTAGFIGRLQQHYEDRGYNYFAVEVLATGEWIGFIGLLYQSYDSPCTPATDIGWRLKRSAWGYGYATEGAKRCLEFGFDELGRDKIVATCTKQNKRSEHVMQKIGMTLGGEFDHPKIMDYPTYRRCLWYEIRKP